MDYRDATPEMQEILASLQAAIDAKVRYSEPPPQEAHLYSLCFEDRDMPDGTTVYGIPCWLPIAETEMWQDLRFRWRRRWHQLGHA